MQSLALRVRGELKWRSLIFFQEIKDFGPGHCRKNRDLLHSRMNLLSPLLLLLLFFGVQFGKPADSYFPLKGFWPQAKPPRGIANWVHWADDIPCSKRSFISGKEGLKSTVTLLCKRQEHQLQLWPGTSPTRNKGVPLLQGALLLEGDHDLSTYNWNSFGLRYGKRQAVKAQGKI